MKPKFLFPHWTRYLGWVLVFVHLPIMMLRRHHGLFAQPDGDELFNNGHLLFIFTALLMAAGLFLVAFSREKIEDEQISQLRLDSLRWAVFVNYIVLIICLVFFNDTQHVLLMNLWVPLFFFIVRFRWMLYRNNRLIKKDGEL